MPPRIGPKKPVRVYLAEHREAHKPMPLSQEQLGNRIAPPVDKGTVSRWEKGARTGKISVGVVAAYAEALGKHTEDMYRPPSDPSLDALAAGLGPELRGRAIGFLEALRERKAG